MPALRSRLTYANVTASLALFVALGGTSYAATSLARNSVGPAQLRADSVGRSELRDKAVTSRVIRDGTILSKDLAASTRASLKGEDGKTGASGPVGPAGATGATGPAGATGPGTPTFRGVFTSSGRALYASSLIGVGTSTGDYSITIGRSLDGCVPLGTLADNPPRAGETGTAPNPTATIKVFARNDRVEVRTYDSSGAPLDQAFNLIVTCGS